MRIPDVILKSVGFVGEVTNQNAAATPEDVGDLHATGFFVFVRFPGEVARNFVYFVTAKHVATDLGGRETYFLVNKRGGGVTVIPPISDTWYVHPSDPTTDVAVVPVGNTAQVDIKAIDLDNFGTPERLAELDIGIGDEIFATGLFTPVAGRSRNEAIVRHGNIAMMPQEQIQTELGYADVYLIEARSIGGLSGCPVFVRPSLRLPQQSTNRDTRNAWAVGHGATLLGLMHGHWDIRESEMNRAFISHDQKRGVNLGIGIVVPAYKIKETINHPELMEIRRRVVEDVRRKSVPGMDSAESKRESSKPSHPSRKKTLRKH